MSKTPTLLRPTATATIPADKQAQLETVLLSRSLLAPDELRVAAEQAARDHRPLTEAIVQQGFVSERHAYEALATVAGMDLIDVHTITPQPLALRLVPERVARRHVLLPLDEDNRTLMYAVSWPFNHEAERDVAFASGRAARAVLALRTELVDAVDRAYPKLADVDVLLERVRSQSSVCALDIDDAALTSASPVIELCNHIVARAIDAGASDVHLEPTPQGLVVRYRVGGILEMAITVPPAAAPMVTNRFKVMGKIDISVKHRPQDGGFRLLINDRPVDVRLSTLPTINGEKLVMRVIDGLSAIQSLDALHYDEANLTRLRAALNRPDGLVLATGPTGSGKTTVLYSALAHLRNGHTNIVSVEDPVERRIPGVNQIAVNRSSGNTFAAVLRSVLRQDPNVLMVGEIRDAEVAQIVGQAAYTGQLVLSTLHTSDAASAITRLMNLGLEPFKIAESLSAIVAQRLLRRLCGACKRTHAEEEARTLGAAHGIERVGASVGRGCDACRHTGYVERMPVAEVLVPNDTLRQEIARGATASEIREAMREAGCRSMRQRALELVVAGETSIEEVDRVLSSETPVTPAAVRKAEKRRVLVVDDDRITRMLVKLLLEREGYEVLEGENGSQAIDIARREHPDLLVIDLMMPEVDGYQAIERIHKDLSLSSLPVMVLTAEAGAGIERRVLDLGADDYIVKPFEPAVLLARVSATFRRLDRAAA
jgi:type IV pilus assembly protein PilB